MSLLYKCNFIAFINVYHLIKEPVLIDPASIKWPFFSDYFYNKLIHRKVILSNAGWCIYTLLDTQLQCHTLLNVLFLLALYCNLWAHLWRHWQYTRISRDVRGALSQSLPTKTIKFPNDVFKFVITEQISITLLSILSIFTVLIFNIYGHQSVGRNIEVTYILQYNHPERWVVKFGGKKKIFTVVFT